MGQKRENYFCLKILVTFRAWNLYKSVRTVGGGGIEVSFIQISSLTCKKGKKFTN